MYSTYGTSQYPFYVNVPMQNLRYMFNTNWPYTCPYLSGTPMSNPYLQQPSPDNSAGDTSIELKDYGPEPFVVDINEAAKQNTSYRTTLWTGTHLQLTLMSLKVGEDIGLEVHPELDQFIRIEEGQGLVKMGDRENNLYFQRSVFDDYAFIIPAGTWHNLYNTGNKPLKLYSIYAPPQHPHGTVQKTKAIAQAAEH